MTSWHFAYDFGYLAFRLRIKNPTRMDGNGWKWARPRQDGDLPDLTGRVLFYIAVLGWLTHERDVLVLTIYVALVTGIPGCGPGL